MKKITFLVIIFLIGLIGREVYSQPGAGPLILIGEDDGSPDNVGVYKIKFGAGAVTDNGDGTVSISGSGASGWTDGGANVYTTTGSDNVGVGTSVPAGRLTIQGAGTTTGINFRIQDSNAAPLVTSLDNGNIGIATTNPGYKLEVAGSVKFNGGGDSILAPTSGNVGIGTSTLAASAKLTIKTNGTGTGIGIQTMDSGSTVRITALDNGNVGIGSTLPQGILDVVGSGGITANGGINVPAGQQYNSVGARVNYNLSVYAAGTVYSLTNTAALLDFGTTDPSLTIDTAGTYLIFGVANLKYNAASYVANQTATIKLRRTNNTAADLTNATTTSTLRIITTVTDDVGDQTVPATIYTTANTNDQIQMFGSVSAAPSAGSVDATEAWIVAIRMY